MATGPQAWGKGYAHEAAQACLDWGFGARNLRSITLMQRLGMNRKPQEDFQHPMLAKTHRLSWHVLFRLPRPSVAAHRNLI